MGPSFLEEPFTPAPGTQQIPQAPNPAPRIPEESLTVPSRENFKRYARLHSRGVGVPEELSIAIMEHESQFNPNLIGGSGEIGLMQLMPIIIKGYGVKDPHNWVENVQGGINYLSYLYTKYKHDLNKTIAAYNAGETAIDKYGGVPPWKASHDYVSSVLDLMAKHTQRKPQDHAFTAPQQTMSARPVKDLKDWMERAGSSMVGLPSDTSNQEMQGMKEQVVGSGLATLFLGPMAAMDVTGTVAPTLGQQFDKLFPTQPKRDISGIASEGTSNLESVLDETLRPAARLMTLADAPYAVTNALLGAYEQDPEHAWDNFAKGSYADGFRQILANPDETGKVLDDWGSNYGVNAPADVYYWSTRPGIMERISKATPATAAGIGLQIALGVHADLAKMKEAFPLFTGLETTALELVNPSWLVPEALSRGVIKPMGRGFNAVRAGAIGDTAAKYAHSLAQNWAKFMATVPLGERWAEMHDAAGAAGEAHGARYTDAHTTLSHFIVNGDRNSAGITGKNMFGKLSMDQQNNLVLQVMGERPVEPRYAKRVATIRKYYNDVRDEIWSKMGQSVESDPNLFPLEKAQRKARTTVDQLNVQMEDAKKASVGLQTQAQQLAYLYNIRDRIVRANKPEGKIAMRTLAKQIKGAEERMNKLQEKTQQLALLQQRLGMAQEQLAYLNSRHFFPTEDIFDLEDKIDYGGTRTQPPTRSPQGAMSTKQGNVWNQYALNLAAGKKVKAGYTAAYAFAKHMTRLRRALMTFDEVKSWEQLPITHPKGQKAGWAVLEPITYDYTAPDGRMTDMNGQPLTFGEGPEGYTNMKENLDDVATAHSQTEARRTLGANAPAIEIEQLAKTLKPEQKLRIIKSMQTNWSKHHPEHSFTTSSTLKIPDLNGYAAHESFMDNLISSHPGYDGIPHDRLPSPFLVNERDYHPIEQSMSVLNAVLRQMFLFYPHFHPLFNLSPVGLAESSNLEKPQMAFRLGQAMFGAVPKKIMNQMEREVGHIAPEFGSSMGLPLKDQIRVMTKPYMEMAKQRYQTLHGGSPLGEAIWGGSGDFADMLSSGILKYSDKNQKLVFGLWENQMSAVLYDLYRNKRGMSPAEAYRAVRRRFGDYNNLGRMERRARWMKDLMWFYGWKRTQAKNWMGKLFTKPGEVFAPVAGMMRFNQQETATEGAPNAGLGSVVLGQTESGDWRMASLPGVEIREGADDLDIISGVWAGVEGLRPQDSFDARAATASGATPGLALRTGVNMLTSSANFPGYAILGALQTAEEKAQEPGAVGDVLFNRSTGLSGADQMKDFLRTMGRRFIPQGVKTIMGASQEKDWQGGVLGALGVNVHYQPGGEHLQKLMGGAVNEAERFLDDPAMPPEEKKNVENLLYSYKSLNNMESARALVGLMKMYRQVHSLMGRP